MSLVHVRALSPAVKIYPGIQITYTTVPFFTGNCVSVCRLLPRGSSVQVPGGDGDKDQWCSWFSYFILLCHNCWRDPFVLMLILLAENHSPPLNLGLDNIEIDWHAIKLTLHFVNLPSIVHRGLSLKLNVVPSSQIISLSPSQENIYRVFVTLQFALYIYIYKLALLQVLTFPGKRKWNCSSPMVAPSKN